MLQSAYGQLPDAGSLVSWLISMHCGCPVLHQPQPCCEAQSVQLPLWPAQKPGQLAGQVANELPEHELSAELVGPLRASHLPLDVQNPQPNSALHESHVVNREHGSPTTAYIGSTCTAAWVWDSTPNSATEPTWALADTATSSETVAPSLTVWVASVSVSSPGIETETASIGHDVPRAAPLAQPRSVIAW